MQLYVRNPNQLTHSKIDSFENDNKHTDDDTKINDIIKTPLCKLDDKIKKKMRQASNTITHPNQ
ncbi:MAG: hypothetical protein Gaeavirus15_12 [Gaeavirus sp.]|uniref:Uncharacterized protein n=1 Tax=Gaeavirus sp. TaxID=2487767 RepID=A0A3G4ZZ89_9VIRU|nr:MAG: hypothetical protein Gaeavirus15_12 [Gaeavirus sp.]